MAINQINNVFMAAIPNPTDKLVALAVADFADRDTGKAWPSLATLQQMTSLAERTVRNALRRLEEAGHLTANINTRGGKGNTSCYYLHVKGAADAPFENAKGAFDDANGAVDAPFENAKGAYDDAKGASDDAKGAADAPDPLRTNRNHQLLLEAPQIPKPRNGPRQMKMERPSLESVLAFVKTLGLPASDGESCYYKWEANDWTNNNKPIRNWAATLRSWKAAGFLPSQRAAGPHRSFGGPIQSPQKKEERAPDQLADLLATVRLLYPNASPVPWAELPLNIRREAEAALASTLVLS